MKRSFIIEEFLLGEKCNFYAIRFDGEEYSMADQLFEKYSKTYKNEVGFMLDRIELIANVRGAQDRYFRPEGTKLDSITALPEKGYGEKTLRLYCLRLSNVCVILGIGATKDPKGKFHKNQELPHINNIMEFMKELDEEIMYRIRDEKDIYYDKNDCLKGNLTFELDIEIDFEI